MLIGCDCHSSLPQITIPNSYSPDSIAALKGLYVIRVILQKHREKGQNLWPHTERIKLCNSVWLYIQILHDLPPMAYFFWHKFIFNWLRASSIFILSRFQCSFFLQTFRIWIPASRAPKSHCNLNIWLITSRRVIIAAKKIKITTIECLR